MPRKLLPTALAVTSIALATIIATVLVLASGGSTTQAAPATTAITVGDTWFCDPAFDGSVCETDISVGDTVSWDFSGASLTHSTRECGASCNNPTMTPLWDSGFISNGSKFQFTFTQPGTFLYRCNVHTTAMRGRIVVAGGAPQPTPTNTLPHSPTLTALPTNTPSAPTPIRTPSPHPGDVDCSGSVNSIDAALVLQLSAGLVQSVPCPQNGDTNRDSRTNSLDAALILQFGAGLISTLPPM